MATRKKTVSKRTGTRIQVTYSQAGPKCGGCYYVTVKVGTDSVDICADCKSISYTKSADWQLFPR